MESPSGRATAAGLELNNTERTLRAASACAPPTSRRAKKRGMMRTLLRTVLAAALAAALPAAADKSDREKEINVGADLLTADDKARTSVFEGNVVVTQGTMRITAAQGHGEGGPGALQVLRRHRLAGHLPPEARQGRRLHRGLGRRAPSSTTATTMLKLFDKARLKSVQGEITGDVITYDMNRELFEVSGAPRRQRHAAARA